MHRIFRSKFWTPNIPFQQLPKPTALRCEGLSQQLKMKIIAMKTIDCIAWNSFNSQWYNFLTESNWHTFSFNLV